MWCACLRFHLPRPLLITSPFAHPPPPPPQADPSLGMRQLHLQQAAASLFGFLTYKLSVVGVASTLPPDTAAALLQLPADAPTGSRDLDSSRPPSE